MGEADVPEGQCQQHEEQLRVVLVLELEGLEELRQIEGERLLGVVLEERLDGMFAQLGFCESWQQELERLGQADGVALAHVGDEMDHGAFKNDLNKIKIILIYVKFH